MKKYELLQNSLNAISDSTINLLILKGSAGFGKSYGVKKYLKEKKISHKYISTYATPLSFYNILYKNRDKQVIVFDDIQTTDKKITAILKSACNNLDKDRIIQWNSTSQTLKDYELPEEFKLKANIIIILNEDLPEFKPIINRAVLLNFKFSFKQKIQILEVYQKQAKIHSDIITYIKKNCNNATKNLSIRTAVILSNLKNNGYDWEAFAEELLNTDEEMLLLNDLISKSQASTDEKIKEFQEATGLSRASYFRHLKKLQGGKD